MTKSSQRALKERKGKGCRNESGNASKGGPEEYPGDPSNHSRQSRESALSYTKSDRNSKNPLEKSREMFKKIPKSILLRRERPYTKKRNGETDYDSDNSEAYNLRKGRMTNKCIDFDLSKFPKL